MTGLKIKDVAARLNVSEKTVYKWLQHGMIPATRLGKTWIVTDEAVDALLRPASLPRPPGQSHLLSGSRASAAPPAPAVSERESLQSALDRFSSILSGAVEHGIDAVLGPRRLDPLTHSAIASVLDEAEGEVLLQGIGLREFFGDKDYTPLLRQMAVDDRPVRVRALLVNPAGQFARARSVAEDGEQFVDESRFRAGPLFGDSWRSLNVIASLRRAGEQARRFSLDVRFIEHWPSVYLVMTAATAFVETYHFGKQDPEVPGSTIEGLVPMLQLSPASRYYRLLRSHFDYLWSGKNPFVPSLKLEQVAQDMQVRL